jgi:flagellar protein FliS
VVKEEGAMLNPYAQYQSTQVNSASPEKILIMLYEGAIKFSRMALDRLEKNDIAGKGKYIGKTLAIVSELMSTLNHEVGGEISLNLERLYIYLVDELSRANMNNSVNSLENVIRILDVLSGTWIEAVEIVKKERGLGQQSDNLMRAAG